MIRFSHAWLLWLLLLLPVFFLLAWQGAGHFERLLKSLGGWPANQRLMPDYSFLRRMLKEGLLLFALAFWIVAAAGPQVGTREVEVRSRGVDVIIAVDVSLSMGAQDLQPDRMARARHSIRRLLSELKGDRVALIPFAGSAFLQHPLTSDYQLSAMMTELLKPGLIPTPGTDLGAAIDLALATFEEQEENDRVLILLSDGEDFAARWTESLSRTRAAGIRVFTVGMASPEGAPVPDPQKQGAYKQDSEGSIVFSRLDEKTLAELAREGGGSYQRSSPGGQELVQVLEVIASLEGREGASKRYTGWQDRYMWFLAPGWLLGLLAWLLPAARTRMALLLLGLLLPQLAKADAVDLTEKGIEAWRQQDTAGSLEAFGMAREELPAPLTDFNLGTALYQGGDLEGAAGAFKSAADGWAAEGEAKAAARALGNLGRTLLDKQESEDALKALMQALMLDPDQPEARHNLEWLLAQQQQDQEQQSDQQKKDEQDSKEQQKGEQNQQQDQQGQQSDQQEQNEQASAEEGQQDPQDQEQGEQEQQQAQQGEEQDTPPEEEGSATAAQPMELDPDQLEQLLREAARQEKGSLERQLEALPRERGKVEKDW